MRSPYLSTSWLFLVLKSWKNSNLAWGMWPLLVQHSRDPSDASWSTILGTPTVAIEDENNKIYRICAMPTIEDRNDHSPLKSEKIGNRGSISSTSSKSDKAVHIKRQKIPRPPNAFILYRQRYHPVVKAEHPEFHNNQICKFTKNKHPFYMRPCWQV